MWQRLNSFASPIFIYNLNQIKGTMRSQCRKVNVPVMRSIEQFERILDHDLEPPGEPTAGTRPGTI